MKVFGEFVLAIVMVFLAAFVTAWGYQVFWNEVVLNVWQLFASGDVVNTMSISYGACLVIAVGIGLIYQRQAEEKTKDLKEAAAFIMGKILSRIIMIGVTLLMATIVF